MPSTPARSSNPVVVSGVISAGVVVAALLLAACDPQVGITLTRADDLNPALPVPFVRFAFRLAGAPVNEPLVQGPFSIGGIPDDFVEVPPGVGFSVDVQGCNEQAEAGCSTENTFIARGCAGGFTRTRDEALQITIALHPADVGNAQCPVEDPASDVFVAPVGEGEGEGEGAG